RTTRLRRAIVFIIGYALAGGLGGNLHRTPEVHRYARRRSSSLAARGTGAAAQDAARRLCRHAAARGSTLYEFPQADGRTWLSGGPQLYTRLHPNTECRWL